jgi:4-hydroxybenzoate polyprenyltransferase
MPGLMFAMDVVKAPIAIVLSVLLSRSARYLALAALVLAEAIILLSVPTPMWPFTSGTGANLSPLLAPIRIRLAFLFVCLDATLALGLHSPTRLASALRNLRWERVVHYVGLCCVGIWLSAPPAYCFVTGLAAVLTVTLAWAASVVGNDLADFEIDRVSNPLRPLITGVWSRSEYARFGRVMLGLALAGAWCVGRAFALCVVTSLALAFLYSSPPFRLRRFLVVSSVLVGLASLVTAWAGFVCLGARQISDFPPSLAAFVFLGLACGANLKDVKDYEGDRRAGVQTFVTVLGLRRGQVAVGALIAAAMLAAPLLLKQPKFWLPAALWAAMAFFVATRPRFRETWLFMLYYSYVALLLVCGVVRPVG